MKESYLVSWGDFQVVRCLVNILKQFERYLGLFKDMEERYRLCYALFKYQIMLQKNEIK